MCTLFAPLKASVRHQHGAGVQKCSEGPTCAAWSRHLLASVHLASGEGRAAAEANQNICSLAPGSSSFSGKHVAANGTKHSWFGDANAWVGAGYSGIPTLSVCPSWWKVCGRWSHAGGSVGAKI